MMARLATARGLAPLRHRRFRLLVGGQLTSNVGDACYAVALPWYVLAVHGGVVLLSLVLAAYGIPRTALLLVGGFASDRWRPWTVMMVTDGARAMAGAGLAVAAGLGPARAAVLIPIAAVLGAGEGLFIPASFAIVPELLPGADLQAGNALSSGGTQLATLFGPAVGGALVALAGPELAFWVDAASFAVSAVTLAGIRAAGQARSATGPVDGEPATAGVLAAETVSAEAPAPVHQPGASRPGDGTESDLPLAPAAPPGRTVRGMMRTERILQVAVVVVVAANLGSGGVGEVALPALAHGPLAAGAAGYGALIAAFGGGALLGTLAAGQARPPRRPFVAGSVAFLAEAAFIAVVPLAGSTILTAAALVAFGALNGFGNMVTITAFQRWAPPDMLGRLSGVLALASVGVFPLSVLLAGLIVRAGGPEPFFWFAAASLAAAILGALTQRSWRDFGTAGPVAPGMQLTPAAATGQAAAAPVATANADSQASRTAPAGG
jgi:predicted MFS family arabinose efflux permease